MNDLLAPVTDGVLSTSQSILLALVTVIASAILMLAAAYFWRWIFGLFKSFSGGGEPEMNEWESQSYDAGYDDCANGNQYDSEGGDPFWYRQGWNDCKRDREENDDMNKRGL